MPKPYIPESLDNYTPVLKPMPVPPIESINDPPLTCIRFSSAFVPYLLGLLEIYRWKDRWAGTDEEKAIAAGITQDFMLLLTGSNCADEGYECTDYPPSADNIIEILPQNPFTDPELVPLGYTQPPFYVVSEGHPGLLVGAKVGDVLTDYTRFVNDLPLWDVPAFLSVGFPRFNVTWNGAAEVELHLVKVPQGGIALITIDENPLTAQLITLDTINIGQLNEALDTLLSVFGLATNANDIFSETIVELHVEGAGEHTIQVAILPQVDSDVIIGIGGGLRSVTICRTENMEVRQNPSEPCRLEYRKTPYETWIQFADLQLCPPLIRQGEDGRLETSPDGGETWEDVPYPIPPRDPENGDLDNRCLASENAVVVIEGLSERLQSEYANTTNVLALAGVAIAFLTAVIFFPLTLIAAIPIVLGLLALAGFGSTNFNDNDRDDLLCLLYCQSYTSEGQPRFNHEGVIADLIADGRPIFLIVRWLVEFIGADGLNRAGAVNAVTEYDCAFCDCAEWCIYFDFETSDYGFGDGSGRMQYFAGTGWMRNPSSPHTSLSITKPIDATITEVELRYWGTIGGNEKAFFATQDDEVLHEITSSSTPALWSFPEGLNLSLDSRFGVDAETSMTDVIFKSIKIKGIGTKPELGDECPPE